MDPLAAEVLAWYTKLAADPSWKAYAWGQVKFLAEQHPSVFGDLPHLLTQRMQQEKRDAAE